MKKKDSMTEFVYILTNPAFLPDLIKIGRTGDLEKRIRDLSSTGVPAPFECYFACKVVDGKGQKIESFFKSEFAEYRFSRKREFYQIDPERAKTILELMGDDIMGEDVTPTSDITTDQDDAETLERARARRPVFRFSEANIPIGAKLNFADDKNIICRVADDRKVDFEGEKMSLNQVTLHVLNKYRDRKLKVIRGPSHWLFEGERLTERRLRLEQPGDDVC